MSDTAPTLARGSTVAALLVVLGAPSLRAQEATVTGTVRSTTGQALPLATVTALDSVGAVNLVAEAATDSSGVFALRLAPGSYLLVASFLSFRPDSLRVDLGRDERRDLGTILLEPSAIPLQDITVRGRRSRLQLGFEERVFRVGRDVTSRGGSVLDVLNQVPSLQTDTRGTVSLRGSSAVRILIDGKPSSIYRNGSRALRNLRADMIQEVQVVTNPSARYSAEGSAGIINIVLKKNEAHGFHGTVGLSQRYPEESQANGELNYRSGAVNWFLNASLARAKDPAYERTYQRYDGPDTAYIYHAFNDGRETDWDGDLEGGADLHLPSEQTLTLSTLWHFENKADHWTGAYVDSSMAGRLLDRIDRRNRIGGGEGAGSATLSYENLLGSDDHKLTASLQFERTTSAELPHITEVARAMPSDTLFHEVEDRRDGHHLRFQADFVRPVADSGKVEAGVRSTSSWADYRYLTRERRSGADWVRLPAFNSNFTAFEATNAAYATLSSTLGPVSYQLGLRAEHYGVHTRLESAAGTARQSYIDFFPSLLLSHRFGGHRSAQVSYSRRISRPDPRLLLPTTVYSDSRIRFTGNPDLLPEYANSYEAQVLQGWSSGSALGSVYYRHRTGVVQRISRLDDQGVLRTVPINLSAADSWGLELTAHQEVGDDLALQASANLFRSRSEGTYRDTTYAAVTNRLTSRLQMRWTILGGAKIQASLHYLGPARTIQGRRSANAFVTTSVSRDFLDGRATLTAGSQDLLGTREDLYTLQDPRYFSRQRSWETEGVRIAFTYRIQAEKDEQEE